MPRFALIAAAGVLGLAGAPAMAEQLLPGLVAKTYCELRAYGVSQDDALQVALSDGRVSVGYSPMITSFGQTVRADVAQSTIAIHQRCPQFLPR